MNELERDEWEITCDLPVMLMVTKEREDALAMRLKRKYWKPHLLTSFDV